MASSVLATVASGAAFGAALTAAGVWEPAVIIGQLRLENFRMLEVFLTATAGSSLLITLARRTSLAPCPARKPNTISRRYDGNVLGGLLQGFGMALTGACPGTVLVQIATGIASAPPVLMGTALGGIAFARWGHLLKSSAPAEKNEVLTLPQAVGVGEVVGGLVFHGACLAAVVAAARQFAPGDGHHLQEALRGGALIALAQAVSLVLTSGTLGTSTAYEQVGKWFWYAVDAVRGETQKEAPAVGAMVFAGAMIAGSVVLQRSLGLVVARDAVDISFYRAVLGGFLLSFGSRVSGGCTSGHGISGMATLSKSSFVTIASMFAGGIALAQILY